MESTNAKLDKLYKSYLTEITEIYKNKKHLDGPHLMVCSDIPYNVSAKKILFVGQENTGWVFRDFKPEGISGLTSDVLYDYCLRCYSMTIKNAITKNNNRKRSSAFWRAVFKVNKELGNSSNPNPEFPDFVYTQVSKCCNLEDLVNKTPPPLSWNDHVEICQKLPLLKNEVVITNPDIVIFFSGPNYDGKLQVQFNNELKFEKLFEDIPSRQIARVIHPGLPFNSIRTYHPRYLQNKSGYLNRIISLLR